MLELLENLNDVLRDYLNFLGQFTGTAYNYIALLLDVETHVTKKLPKFGRNTHTPKPSHRSTSLVNVDKST